MKQIDRIGVNTVERIVIKQLGWTFREQTVSDWGIGTSRWLTTVVRLAGFSHSS